jgi:CRISPR-associated protein Cmr4
MFAAAECLFLYLESSLRVGSGLDRNEVDLPLEREAATGYPLLPASTLKGVLRGRARMQQAPDDRLVLLGSEPESEERQPSVVVVSDAVPLLFPVRSLTGLFGWTTSVEVWSRLRRDLASYGVRVNEMPQPPALRPDAAGVAPESPLVGSKPTLVLEELSFPVQVAEEVRALGSWLAAEAFPADPVFDYWRERAERGVVLLPEGAYRYVLKHRTQVMRRIRIDPTTGTAAEGALWTEEFLPPESMVYALVGVNPPDPLPTGIKDAAGLIDWVRRLVPGTIQVGSGRTLGRGIVRARWTEMAEPPARPAEKAKGKGKSKKS